MRCTTNLPNTTANLINYELPAQFSQLRKIRLRLGRDRPAYLFRCEGPYCDLLFESLSQWKEHMTSKGDKCYIMPNFEDSKDRNGFSRSLLDHDTYPTRHLIKFIPELKPEWDKIGVVPECIFKEARTIDLVKDRFWTLISNTKKGIRYIKHHTSDEWMKDAAEDVAKRETELARVLWASEIVWLHVMDLLLCKWIGHDYPLDIQSMSRLYASPLAVTKPRIFEAIEEYIQKSDDSIASVGKVKEVWVSKFQGKDKASKINKNETRCFLWQKFNRHLGPFIYRKGFIYMIHMLKVLFLSIVTKSEDELFKEKPIADYLPHGVYRRRHR